MSPDCCEIGPMDEEGSFPAAGGTYVPVKPTRKDRASTWKDRVPSDRSEAALYDYVNITITQDK
jgi:hypothetical protein